MTKDEIMNMPAGYEMNALVLAEVFDVMPFKGEDGKPYKLDSDQEPEFIPNYSEDISAAWEVVKYLQRNGYSFELTEHADPQGDYILQIWRRDMEISIFTSRADTAQLAICRAALLAVTK